MQDNRSFDVYFGTFPDVDGLPTHDVAQVWPAPREERPGWCWFATI
jgi:phospholipase C